MSLWEWRTIALLGAPESRSLGHLARAAGIDKSQMSRVVSGLARRLVLRAADPGDGRGVRLTLTKTGQRLYTGLIRAAASATRCFAIALARAKRRHSSARSQARRPGAAPIREELSETRITELLGIEHPIFQAAMSWASSNAPLVIAVSNAGGMGVLGAGR